jgi:hypothetical protein
LPIDASNSIIGTARRPSSLLALFYLHNTSG